MREAAVRLPPDSPATDLVKEFRQTVTNRLTILCYNVESDSESVTSVDSSLRDDILHYQKQHQTSVFTNIVRGMINQESEKGKEITVDQFQKMLNNVIPPPSYLNKKKSAK